MTESTTIYVRGHITASKKKPRRAVGKRAKKRKRRRHRPAKWTDRILVFDTETRIDTEQKLTFGCYRLCKLGPQGYESYEEGLFHADDLPAEERRILESYVQHNRPKNDCAISLPQVKLFLTTRQDFVEHVFWQAVKKGYLIVGFNLPFDISRIAESGTRSARGGWSLGLTLRANPLTGIIETHPWKPRIVIEPQHSRSAFLSLSSIFIEEEWPNEGRFLDLRTLGAALRDESFSLRRLCREFNGVEKIDHEPTGRVTVEEIDYCRGDVRSTLSALNPMKKEFDRHPIDLLPDKAYSTASLAKAYLEAMGIALPQKKFKVSKRMLGIAMQSYYGGRAECRIRRSVVPVVHTDFTSQYPTVNRLFRNWRTLIGESVDFEECTKEVDDLLHHATLDSVFARKFWGRLSFFALIKPDEDILPVRTLYNGRSKNIGSNLLTCSTPVWFAGPDLVASVLLSGTNKVPKIIKAVRIVRTQKQARLKSTKLSGIVAIDPRKSDFYCEGVEQKSLYKTTNKGLSHFLKILVNSGSYGLFVEVNPETRSHPAEIKAFSGEITRTDHDRHVENPGRWYFPPLASLITAGGRLLLAMLERCVEDAGGSYLFCDTDSMSIVASSSGGLVACPGGRWKLNDGHEAVRALSYSAVKAIAKRFSSLNPYKAKTVPEILKIEDINYVDSNPCNPARQLFGYSVSAKRYALFTKSQRSISIVKCSGHGLGYLQSPVKLPREDEDLETPRWITEAWTWLLQKELRLKSRSPKWLNRAAMMRMSMSTPNVLKTNRPSWLKPFNFFLFPIVSPLGGYPAGCDKDNFQFIVPYDSNPTRWNEMTGINLRDRERREYRMTTAPSGGQREVVPDTLRIVLQQYLNKAESKSLAPDGSPCSARTSGLLRRAHVVATDVVPVCKETDRRWEEGADISLIDSKVKVFNRAKGMVVADRSTRNKGSQIGPRELIRRTKLSQKAVYAVLNGERVRQHTLDIFKRALAK